MAADSLKRSVSGAPDLPGVYRFLDGRGKVLYIGKAKSLIKRLRGHLSNPGDARHRTLLEKSETVQWTVTRTELEALVLESELIRMLKPPLNVDLRSSSRYPWLEVTAGEKYPRLVITRNPDRSLNIPRFGPYPDAGNLKSLVAFLMDLYPLRRCAVSELKPRKRPCLMGQMDRCPSPCSVEQEREYAQRVERILYILRGHWDQARKEIITRMENASKALEFEKAAALRDLLRRLDSFGWPTPESLRDSVPRDVMAVSENWGIVIQVRGGRFMGSLRLPFTSKWKLAGKGELISILVRSYYSETGDVPRQVVLGSEPDDRELLETWLSEKRGSPVEITVPERGGLRSLVDVAERDLRNFLNKLEWKHPAGKKERLEASLEAIADILGLEGPPEWMVCLDASTIQGHSPVAALVSFRKGKPDKNGYRRFTMPEDISRNDPAMIGNAVTRFASHLEDEHPGVFLIDGGITQLRAAWAAGSEFMPGTRFVSIAKKEEVLLTAPEEKEIKLPRDAPPLLLLRAMRDEAHRFVISFHRSRRARSHFHSALDDIPGIGPALKASLLGKFGSVSRIAAASEQEIAEVPGIGRRKAAEILKALK
ncbi:MAG TPA: excinuclease ABC subunit UvrC [Candidatus Sabulitectum sp.]|nr:excinuclease ABC subunit UvrC [Candidatus Sabulitectum sp.]